MRGVLMRQEYMLWKVANKLTTLGRKHIANKNFALPGGRYPIHDRKHAVAALAYGKKMLNRGKLSGGEYRTIVAKVKNKYPTLGQNI